MNKTFDDFDIQIQPEEVYAPGSWAAQMAVIMWLTEQSLRVKVWNN